MKSCEELATRIVNLSGDYDSADEGLEDSVIAQVQSIISDFCKKQQQRISELEEALIKSEQSRQVLFVEKDLLLSANIGLGKRAKAAEAELARRDAAAGEPVGVVQSDSWIDEDCGGEHFWVEWASNRFPEKGTKLFTAAQPPALPPERMTGPSNGSPQGAWFNEGYNQAIADAKALGCKAIKLPKIKHPAQFDYADDVVSTLKAQGLSVEGDNDE